VVGSAQSERKAVRLYTHYGIWRETRIFFTLLRTFRVPSHLFAPLLGRVKTLKSSIWYRRIWNTDSECDIIEKTFYQSTSSFDAGMLASKQRYLSHERHAVPPQNSFSVHRHLWWHNRQAVSAKNAFLAWSVSGKTGLRIYSLPLRQLFIHRTVGYSCVV